MGQRSGPSRSLPGRGPGRRRALKPARRTFAPVARAFVSTAKAVAWCRGHYMSIPCWRQFRVCVSVRRGPLSRVRVQGSAGCRAHVLQERNSNNSSRPTGCRAAMCAVCKHVSEATLFSRDRVTSHTHTSRWTASPLEIASVDGFKSANVHILARCRAHQGAAARRPRSRSRGAGPLWVTSRRSRGLGERVQRGALVPSPRPLEYHQVSSILVKDESPEALRRLGFADEAVGGASEGLAHELVDFPRLHVRVRAHAALHAEVGGHSNVDA
jgi:hypothetical protein